MSTKTQSLWRVIGYVTGVVFGLGLMLYVYAFASMVDPDLEVSRQRLLIGRKIFLSGSVVPFLFGFLLSVFGLLGLGKTILKGMNRYP